MNVQQMQAHIVKEGMEAKRDFEIEEQATKVRALVRQVQTRLDALNRLNDDLHREVGHAADMPVHYPVGVFGHDTETIDALLSTLTEESANLDQMRAAKAKTEEMSSRYLGMVDEMVDKAEAEANGTPEEGGRIFEMPGTYL